MRIAWLLVPLVASTLAGCAAEPPSERPGSLAVAVPRFGCPRNESGPLPCFTPWDDTSVRPISLAAHPSDPRRLAVLLDDRDLDGPEAGASIAVSQDSGASWSTSRLDPPLTLGDQGLTGGSLALTANGTLVLAGRIEERPDPLLLLELSYPFEGRLWVGRSMDEGRTWTTLLEDPADPGAISISALGDGRLVLAVQNQGEPAMTLRISGDDGASWPAFGIPAMCYEPSPALLWHGAVVLACNNLGWAPDPPLTVLHLAPGKSNFERLGSLGPSECSVAGPVAAGPHLVAVRQCDLEVTLLASSEGGEWKPWGAPVPLPAGDPASALVAGIGAAADGAVAAFVQFGFRSVPTCVCEAEVRLVAWASDGRVAAEEVILDLDTTDADGGVALGPASATWTRRGAGTAFLMPETGAIGWLEPTA